MNSLGIRTADARQRALEAKHLRYGDTLWARKHRVILREHLATFATPSPSLAAVLTRCGVGALPGEVGAFTEQFTPRLPDGVWDRIGAFVRDSVVLASPQTAYSVEILLTAAAHYVAWCLNQGWPLEAETIWSRQAIDLYVTDQYSHLAEGTRRNYRARLMRVSEVVLPEEHGEKMTALNRKSTAAPYSAGQMARHREWAAAQTSPFKRYRAMLMLVLAAGAGLKANEIADLPPENVQPAPGGGYLITVAGTGVTARTVPLLAEWDEWMTAVLEDVPADHTVLWGPPNRTRGNAILSSFTQYTIGDAPRGDRLRATWLVTHLTAGVPIKALSTAAGVAKFEHLPRLLAYVPDIPHADYVNQLRGGAR